VVTIRVLVVSRASYALPTSQGGTDAYSLRTSLFLVPRGHEVFLVGQGRPGPAFGRVKFVRVPTDRQVTSRYRVSYFVKGLFLSLASVLTAAKFLYRHRESIDIIHSNSNLGAILLKRLFPEKPLVYTMHDPIAGSTPTKTMFERFVRLLNNGLFERMALRRSDHVVAVSGDIRAQAEQVIGPSEKLTLLYPFLSVSPSGGKGPSAAPAATPAPLPYILSVGAQTGRKRFDLIIQALSLNGPELDLVLVGTGPDRQRLVRTAEICQVRSRVTFVDRVSDSNLEKLYREALAYVIVSEREGFPATLVEAALSGTPALYFTDSPTPDLDDKQSDFFRVTHSLSPVDIAKAIGGICSRTDLDTLGRRRIASWARARFPTSESVAHELSDIYDLVVGSAVPAAT
jgi:glycosyltransferase involved in cell wall biosynthesis